MSFKAVIFDMDGVIVDTEPEYQRVELELVSNSGDAISIADFKEYKGVHPIVMWTDIKKKHHLPQTVGELYEAEKKMMEAYYKKGKLRVIKPTVKLIKQAHKNGYKTAVASASEKVNILQVLKRLRISKYFDAVVSCNDVEKSKPDPDIYLLAAKLLGVSTAECVVIEDSIAGTISAKTAGMKALARIAISVVA